MNVEVLDVTEEEARKLFLTSPPSPPWPTLAQTQEQIHERLVDITPAADRALRAFWERAAQIVFAPDPPGPKGDEGAVSDSRHLPG